MMADPLMATDMGAVARPALEAGAGYAEQAILFGCEQATLVGVLTLPAPDPTATGTAGIGVLVVVGGPQYRVGSHRQFVLLARALAGAGYPVLRFDVRGMGDSIDAPRGFEQVTQDIGAAIEAFASHAPQLRGFVLWGLCDGASAALLYCHEARDPRIAGLCLVNPWVRSEASLARTQVKHYYGQRLLQREFWRKLASGRIGWTAIHGLLRGIVLGLRKTPSAAARRTQPFQIRMAQAWMTGQHPKLLLLSGSDYTAKEFLEHSGSDQAWAGALAQATVQRVDLPEADHTLSDERARCTAQDRTIAWLRGLERPRSPQPETTDPTTA